MSFDVASMGEGIETRVQYSHVIDAQDRMYFN